MQPKFNVGELVRLNQTLRSDRSVVCSIDFSKQVKCFVNLYNGKIERSLASMGIYPGDPSRFEEFLLFYGITFFWMHDLTQVYPETNNLGCVVAQAPSNLLFSDSSKIELIEHMSDIEKTSNEALFVLFGERIFWINEKDLIGDKDVAP